LVLIQSDEEAFSFQGGIFPLQNPLNIGFGSQHSESTLNNKEHIPTFLQSMEIQDFSIII